MFMGFSRTHFYFHKFFQEKGKIFFQELFQTMMMILNAWQLGPDI